MFFFILSYFNLFGNEDFFSNDSTTYQALIDQGDDFFYQYDSKSASEYYRQAIELAQDNSWDDLEINGLINLLYAKIQSNVFREIEKVRNDIEEKFAQSNRSDSKEILELQVEYSIALMSHIVNSGGNLREVIKLGKSMETSLEQLQRISPNQESNYLRVYVSISNAYTDLGYYQQAIAYANKAKETRKYHYTLSALGELYFKVQEYSKSRACYLEYIQDLKTKKYRREDKSFILINGYQGLAKNYLQENKFDEALKYLEKSLPLHAPQSPQLPLTYNLLGDAYLNGNQNDLVLAEEKFKEALNRQRNFFDEDSQGFQFYEFYLNLGDVAIQKKNYDTAFQYYQKAFKLLNTQFESTRIKDNPSPDVIDFPLETLATFNRKINAIRNQYEHSGSIDSLTAKWGLQTCEAALDWMNSIFSFYSSEQDQQLFIEQSYSVFENAIFFSYQLGQMDVAFEYSEQSRSIILKQARKRKASEIFSQDNNELVKEMKFLKFKKIALERQKRDPANLVRLDSLRGQIAWLNEKIQILNDSLFQKYPSLKNSINRENAISIQTIASRLKSKQVLVEFFVGEKDIYAFHINKEGLQKPQKIKFTAELKKAIDNINDYIYAQYDHKDPRYAESGYLIYQELFQSLFPEKEIPERLIIVPDGNLGYLPFNILLTKKVNLDTINSFINYPYLFKQSSISLAFSAAWQFNVPRKIVSPSKNKILAYAPNFKKLKGVSIENMRNQEVSEEERGVLDTLEYTYEEIQMLKHLFGAETILFGDATRDHFTTFAKDYSILHLATHAKVNKYEPDYSFVAFSNLNKDNSLKPDHLYKLSLGEIYASDFRSKMIVLSACETGIGKSMKGEGIISISRGFAYAGIPSIVSTLWNINDRTSAKVMEGFYKNLGKGLDKDLALKTTFLDYINTKHRKPDYHPQKWAAFTVIGNVDNVSIHSNWGIEIYLIIGIISLLFLFGISKKVIKV